MGKGRACRATAFAARRFFPGFPGQAGGRRDGKTRHRRPLETGLRVETGLRIKARDWIETGIHVPARRFETRFGIEAGRVQTQRAAAGRAETRLSLSGKRFVIFFNLRRFRDIPMTAAFGLLQLS